MRNHPTAKKGNRMKGKKRGGRELPKPVIRLSAECVKMFFAMKFRKREGGGRGRKAKGPPKGCEVNPLENNTVASIKAQGDK